MFNFISKSTHKAVVADLYAEIDSLARSLRDERTRARTSGQMASEFLAERDAARIERDQYREQLLRFTGPRERGPGGRFVKAEPAPFPTPGSAADVKKQFYQTIS